MKIAIGVFTFTELSRIVHQCHVLGSEMVHFIQQTQYYISFEVSHVTSPLSLKQLKSMNNGKYFIRKIIIVFFPSILMMCHLSELNNH